MHVGPPLHPWRGPLHIWLGLWEKRIPHLQWALHRYRSFSSLCSNNSKSSQEILLTQSTTPTTLISNTQHQICAACEGNAHSMSKAEVTSSSFKRSYSRHQQQWIRVPWSSRMQVSINPREGDRKKLYPALALKEKCVPQTVSWTWDGAYATNTTSAQTGSEVSLTYSQAFKKPLDQVMRLAATTTLTLLTIFLEISIILKQTSAWLPAWRHVEKMVTCWQGWGGYLTQKLVHNLQLQRSSVLPLRQCGAPHWVFGGVGYVWRGMSSFGMDGNTLCRPLGNDHVWALW